MGGAIVGSGGAVSPSDGGAGGAPIADGGSGCPAPPSTAGAWSEIAAPADAVAARASDAFAVTDDDILFAVSIPAPGDSATTRIIRWSHGCWSTELTFPTAGAGLTPSVHGTGPSDLWAVAGQLVYHRDAVGWSPFDGSWTAQATPIFFDTELALKRVRAAGAGDVWVLETNHVLHWTGGAWTVFNFDDADYPTASASIAYLFTDLWIDAPNSVWVAGGSDVVGSTMDPSFVHHFDGSGWTRHGVGVFGVESIVQNGAGFLLAEPGNTALIGGSYQPVTLFQYDPAAATVTPVPAAGSSSDTDFTEVRWLWRRAANDIWAAGSDVVRFDGQTAAVVADAPAPARAPSDFQNTFVTGDAHAVWLVTPGRFFRMPIGP